MSRLRNSTVDDYLAQGCGGCPLYDTPECKVHFWTKELQLLRSIALDCGLTEEVKWDIPCYTWNKKNIVLLGAFKENCVLSFFKGMLLRDEYNILEKPGEHTQSVKLVRFTSVDRVVQLEAILREYLFEAIEIEKAGLKVVLKKTEEYEVVEEFTEAMKQVKGLKTAFEQLTPGRQRGYLLHFSQAKQSKTRQERVEKCIPKILAGKGFADR